MTEVLSGEEETLQAGRIFAAELRPDSVVALTGDLGAGKTCFTKGVASGLGFEGSVSSPTFSLVHEYPAAPAPIFHFDFYRLDSLEELLDIGWDDYLSRDGIVIAEWADKFPDALPEETIWISLNHSPNNRGHRVLKR